MKKRYKYDSPICSVLFFTEDVICSSGNESSGFISGDDITSGPGGFSGEEQLFYK